MGKGKPWSEEDLAYLSEYFGRKSDSAICAHLDRSVNALKIAAYRKLNGLRRKDNFYTSAEIARLLGVKCSKTVIYWKDQGWLTGKYSHMRVGLNRVWCFEEQNVVKFLQERPWIVKCANMPVHYFRSIVREEWEKDRWYTTAEAAPLLGIIDINAVHRYIYKGWLPKIKKPGLGPHQGKWIFRHSHIQTFLDNDPRPTSRRRKVSAARKKSLLDSGRPTILAQLWRIKCGACGMFVRITAPPKLSGPRIKEIFLRDYSKSPCVHEDQVIINP